MCKFDDVRFAVVAAVVLGTVMLARDFALAQCTIPVLGSGTAVTTSVSPQAYSFPQGAAYYSAVGVRPDASTDWNIEVYQASSATPPCVSTLLGGSSRATGVDFVIGDFNLNHNPQPASYYPLATRATGSGDGTVEWDDGANSLTVNGALISRNTGATDVLEVWDVNLAAGTTYTFTFNTTGADLKLLLFRSPSTGTYWAGRDNRLFEATTTTTFTPTLSGFHGVVVINENGAVGSYTLGVGTCQTPTALASGTSVSNSLAEKYYSFAQSQIYWTAVGVRGSQPAANWQVEVYGSATGGTYPVCLSSELGASAVAAPTVDFVVGDFNELAVGTFYARVHLENDLGSGTARVEWDNGIDVLDPDPLTPPPTPTIMRNTDANDVLEVWDVYMELGVPYHIYFNSAGADVRLFLFPPSVDWAGRSAAVHQQVGGALAAPFVAAEEGYHGLVVVNENGATGTYELRVYRDGVLSADGAGPPPTALGGVRPNPARGAARVHFTLHEPGQVSFEILDIAGRRVGQTEPRTWDPGRWSIGWRPEGGAPMSPGVYFVTMKVDGRIIARSKFTMLN